MLAFNSVCLCNSIGVLPVYSFILSLEDENSLKYIIKNNKINGGERQMSKETILGWFNNFQVKDVMKFCDNEWNIKKEN